MGGSGETQPRITRTLVAEAVSIWEFPKIGVPYFGGPYNKDPTIQGAISGSPIFGNFKEYTTYSALFSACC